LYALVIAVSVAMVVGRILSVVFLIEPWTKEWPADRPATYPTLSSNDRSRWATIRALVDEGTYVVGKRVVDPETGEYEDSGIRSEEGFTGVDYVLRPGDNLFFSSKPPLLSTLLAGPYWVLQKLTGWTLAEQPGEVVRTLLVLYNALPLLVYLVVLSGMLDRYGRTEWGRSYVLLAASFGTFLTTFCMTLNNHTFAAFSTLFVLCFLLRIWNDGDRRWWVFALAGLLAGLNVACEMPAAAFAAGVFVLLLSKAPARTLLGYVPALALVVAAMLLTNYLAIGRFVPAYSFQRIDDPGNPDFGWYHFQDSHWTDEKIEGIDAADEPKTVYAMHALVGHHGIFSLSPIFLLSVWGAFLAIKEASPLRVAAALTVVLSVVVGAFYIAYTNNYGGSTAGLRWTFWLIPLWLVLMLPAADRLVCCRAGRAIGLALLAVSALSAAYPTWNPWRATWLYRWMEYLGWFNYP
jgi:hypothetical protein